MSGDWLFGYHAVEAALREGLVSEVLLARGDRRGKALEKLAHSSQVAVTALTGQEFEQRFRGQVHQGVAGRVESIRYLGDAELHALLDTIAEPLLLVLDQIQDPRNFGACLRTAEAAGVHAVIFPRDRSTEITPAAAKTAAGAAARLPLVQVTNLATCLDGLKRRNIWLTGADAHAPQHVHQVDLTGPTAIVMGNEGRGLRRLTRDKCDFLAAIPMAGAAESLNVSVATGIFLFEAVRQRNFSRE